MTVGPTSPVARRRGDRPPSSEPLESGSTLCRPRSRVWVTDALLTMLWLPAPQITGFRRLFIFAFLTRLRVLPHFAKCVCEISIANRTYDPATKIHGAEGSPRLCWGDENVQGGSVL
jgi:hypothetical protein